VDGCEREPERAMAVNAEGTRRVVTELEGSQPGNPQRTLGTSTVLRITFEGRISGKVASVEYRPIGQVSEPPQVALGFAQSVAKLANDLAAFRSRQDSPFVKGLLRALRGALALLRRGGADRRKHPPVNGRDASQ
jgi:hypothetical protein